MLVDSSKTNSCSFFRLQPSHRPWAEQTVGAFIFFLVSSISGWLFKWPIYFFPQLEWLPHTISVHWAFMITTSSFAWIMYNTCATIAIWNLWRRYLIKSLKLELSVFLLQFPLLFAWSVSFFAFHEPLIALLALLFLCSNAILSIILFWKKDSFSGQILILNCLWTFYIVALNMKICIFNTWR